MGYITVAEAARLWGVSERTVRNYCAEGRIPGAELIGKTWAIPEGADRPGRRPTTHATRPAMSRIFAHENDSVPEMTPYATVSAAPMPTQTA